MIVCVLIWCTDSPSAAQEDIPLSFKHRLVQVQTLCNERAWEKAYRAAGEMTQLYGSEPEGWFWLGRVAGETQRYEEGLAAFQKAIGLKEDYAEAHHERGCIHEHRKQYQQASRAFWRAGDIYRREGIWEKAIQNYEKVKEVDLLSSSVDASLQACQDALDEEQRLGYVQAKTLMLLARLPSVTQEEGGMIRRGISLPTESGIAGTIPVHIEFGFGQHTLSDLSSDDRQQVEQIALTLTAIQGSESRIVIEGHTCSCGARTYNEELARKRAESIRDYLVSRGIRSEDTIAIVSYGEDRPIAFSTAEDLSPILCERDAAHSMNRRVVIREWIETDKPAVSPIVVTSEPDLSAWISLWYRRQDSGDPFRPLEEDMTLHSGDQIRLFLMASQPAHAYIFHHSSDGEWVCLFPNKEISPNLQNPLKPGEKYWLPGYDSSFTLDEVPGLEETLVYLSPAPSPELDKWIREGVPPDAGPAINSGTRGLGGTFIPEDSGTDGELLSLEQKLPEIRWFQQIRFRHEP